MKNIAILILSFVLTTTVFAQDTFSIIAVDPVTGDIGSAGASCVTGVGAAGIIDIITDIIPGRGGVNSQAYVCIPNVNLQNAIIEMENGSSPSEIITYLLANDACGSQGFDPAYRQYGIADFDPMGNPRTAGFSGSSTDDYKEDRQGANYSIQGNILLNQSVIDNMESNFNSTTGSLADKLMAAMQGANFAGADSRCLADGTSSTTAYLLVYKQDDDPNEPYIRLNVGQQSAGVEPIDLLQNLYDNFLAVEENPLVDNILVTPNPVLNELTIEMVTGIELKQLEIFDLGGKLIMKRDQFRGKTNSETINVSTLKSGIYFIKLGADEGELTIKFVKQ